jgi:hypothetical protein
MSRFLIFKSSKIIVLALIALVVMLLIGWYVGRVRQDSGVSDHEATYVTGVLIGDWNGVPVHPDAEVRGSLLGGEDPAWATWSVVGAQDQIVAWYIATLRDGGWETTVSEGSTATLSASRGDRRVTLTFLSLPENTVLIQAAK